MKAGASLNPMYLYKVSRKGVIIQLSKQFEIPPPSFVNIHFIYMLDAQLDQGLTDVC